MERARGGALRYNSRVSQARVVVVGGHGFFGRLVVDGLLASTRASIAVVSRRRHALDGWDAQRVEHVQADQHDPRALRRILAGAAVVVHAAGPYQGLAPSVLAAALEARVAYVDLADDRSFVRRAEQLVADRRGACPPVLLGMSYVPALCAWMVELARGELAALERIRCVASPGSRGSRGRATLESLLSSAGRAFDVPRRHGAERVHGWSRPVRCEYPAPFGARTAYLAIPVADFDLFPRWFGCADVEFRAGSDLPLLDRGLWIVAGAQRWIRVLPLVRCANAMARIVGLAGRIGSDAGAGMVELADARHVRRVAVVARTGGQRLPALPAAFATAALLEGRLRDAAGLVAANQVLTTEQFVHAMRTRGIAVWLDRGDGWREVSDARG
ncbi:MAG: NAD-dependent epimerase/dehydratase family protein [Planctomycetota bacterium]|nr:MAG: NAD-dependent epimerase/dehydratase family protein [Planctomycetota bacterium]